VDDLIRQTVIQSLMCQNTVSYVDIARQLLENPKFKTVQSEALITSFEFISYFADELAKLLPLAEDGLLTFTSQGFELTPLGRIFSRNVAMIFDAHLVKPSVENVPDVPATPQFSRTL
jgi:oxygen-independent coproporphyrinogen-3 oxidase